MQITWHEIKKEFLNKLVEILGEVEANSVFKLTFEYFTGNFPPKDYDLQKTLSAGEKEEVEQILSRLLMHEPIQYILGYAWFYDLKLKVNDNVLIPRQETEELVHWILNKAASKPRMRILDLGCGSGAIGLSLAKFIPDSQVLLGDISPSAVQVAEENSVTNEIENVEISELDMLSLPDFPHKFDVIVSNPPYVDLDFKEKMPKNVIDFEPNIALFAPEKDPLCFYRAIAEFAIENLKSDGFLFFEINEFFKDDLCAMLQGIGFSGIEAKKDLNGKWRMVRAEV